MTVCNEYSLLLRARLAQLCWPCYRALIISSVMPCHDKASKTGVWWPRAWPFPTVSNVTSCWPITDQLALSSSILLLCHSCSNCSSDSWIMEALYIAGDGNMGLIGRTTDRLSCHEYTKPKRAIFLWVNLYLFAQCLYTHYRSSHKR